MVLMIDNHDSFTCNLVQCFAQLGEALLTGHGQRMPQNFIEGTTGGKP